jgi:hypothetical protein
MNCEPIGLRVFGCIMGFRSYVLSMTCRAGYQVYLIPHHGPWQQRDFGANDIASFVAFTANLLGAPKTQANIDALRYTMAAPAFAHLAVMPPQRKVLSAFDVIRRSPPSRDRWWDFEHALAREHLNSTQMSAIYGPLDDIIHH